MQETRVSRIIKYLKDTYTFDDAFTNEELEGYGFKNKNLKPEWIKHPIFFSANIKKNALKVMAFGGCITTLPLDENQEYFFDDEKISMKKFARYLSPLANGNERFYKNGNGHLFYLPGSFVGKYAMKGSEELRRLLNKRDYTIEQLLTNKSFVDMLVCSAYVRFMHRPEGIMEDIGERSMETIVSRYAWENYKKNNLVVIDIEYKPELPYKVPSMDFLVLDKKKKSFGLIEFKYQGMSMAEKGTNSLSVHFNDFVNAILDEDVKRSILRNIMEHFSLLIEAEIFSGKEMSDLLEEINSKIKKDDIENCLWCGFFFLDEKRILSTRKKIKGNVPLVERIEYDSKRQVVQNPAFADIIESKKMNVRYQHSYIEDSIELRMDEDMIEKFSEGHKPKFNAKNCVWGGQDDF